MGLVDLNALLVNTLGAFTLECEPLLEPDTKKMKGVLIVVLEFQRLLVENDVIIDTE